MKMRTFAPTLLAVSALTFSMTAIPMQASAEPGVARGKILDRQVVNCGQSTRMISRLERDSPRRLEVDADIYGPPRRNWVIRIRHNGNLAHTIRRHADRDGELDVYRYIPDKPGQDRVRVTARGGNGLVCRANLRG